MGAAGTKGSAPTFSTTYNGLTNRDNGQTYDTNGNLGSASSYDVENRLVGAGGLTYGYDGGNKRLSKHAQLGVNENGDVLGAETLMFYGVGGERLAESTMATVQIPTSPGDYYLRFTEKKTLVWFGSKLLRDGKYIVIQDRLGSVRWRQNQVDAPYAVETADYYPYGQEKPGATVNDREKFATYMRYPGSGLDYANQRYHEPGWGRFLMPDPYQASGGPGEPGIWNRYAYVQGDPANRNDANGPCKLGALGHDCLQHRGGRMEVVGVLPQGRRIPEEFVGQEYTVFVDESFYRFFDFRQVDGNFAHGVVGLPSRRIKDFELAVVPTIERFYVEFHAASGTRPRELKSTDIYRLAFPARRRFFLRIRDALSNHGGFVAGFYTSNRGYIMEKIREDSVGQLKAIPEDHQYLYDAKVAQLEGQMTGPGQSDLIADLLFLPIIVFAHFLNSSQSPFKVICDPRQEHEDTAVKDTIEGMMKALKNPEITGVNSKLISLDAQTASRDSIGLQIADIVAGEVRRFFRYNSELLTEGSGLELIDFEFHEGEDALLDYRFGRVFKKGRRVTIPPRLLRRSLSPRPDTALGYFRNLLAAGLVTCVTEFGTERDVAIFEGNFLDISD